MKHGYEFLVFFTHHLVSLGRLEERVFVVAAQKPAGRKQGE